MRAQGNPLLSNFARNQLGLSLGARRAMATPMPACFWTSVALGIICLVGCGGTATPGSQSRQTGGAASGTSGGSGTGGSSSTARSNEIPTGYCGVAATPFAAGPIAWHVTAPLTSGITTDFPGSNDQAAVWTGQEMLLWGGDHIGTFSCPGAVGGPRNTGARYDRATGTWTSISTTNAPTGRDKPAAVWTGSELIVWGGYNDPIDSLADGGRYDLATDQWMGMASTGAPPHSCGASVAWTGHDLVLWLGETGGWLYSPGEDTWRNMATPTTTYHLNGPSTAGAWTGQEFIAVGGINWSGRECTREAAAYEPSRNQWRALSSPPICVSNHQAFWTGSQLLLWSPQSGALYDPCSDSWKELPQAVAPVTPTYTSTLWAGNQLLVRFITESDLSARFYRYDPARDAWSLEAPPTSFATAIWGGDRVIVLDY
jgi:hypothetical protein